MGGQSLHWRNPPMNHDHFSREESLIALHHGQEDSSDF